MLRITKTDVRKLKSHWIDFENVIHDCYSAPSHNAVQRLTPQTCDELLTRCQCLFNDPIHPIHVTAMMNIKRGLEGKFARQYVKRDVTSLLLHVPVT